MNNLIIGTLMVLVSIPWWTSYFVRLFQVVYRGHFGRMPNLYICLNPYGMGLLYYLCSYELEQQVQTSLAFTHLPVASIVKILISAGIVSYGYILMVRRYTRFTITRKVDPLLIGFTGLTILLNLVLYDRIPYFKLQILTNVLTSFALILASFSILPMMRRLMSSRQNQVRDAHRFWSMVLILAAACAATLMWVDGVQKLLTDSVMIYSPLFVITEVSHSLHMLAAAFLIGPDRYLYWIYYPHRWMTYIKLRRLVKRIQQQTQLQTAYDIPMPRLPTQSALEFANYRLFIVIMDNYRHLPEDSPLSLALAAIDHQNAPYDETIRQLQTLI